MPRRHRLEVALASVVAATLICGCAAPGSRAAAPPTRRGSPWPDALIAPPGEGAAEALARATLRQRATYLVDLFDAARLLGDSAAREMLWRALRGSEPDGGAEEAEPERGEEATLRALAALADLTRSAGLPSLSELIELDREQLEGGDPAGIAAHRRELGRDEDAAGHALLSRYGACAQALADAAAALPWRRALIANRCLHELDGEDAAPLLAGDPAARPPDPSWRRLADGQKALLEQARLRAPRLSGLIDRLLAVLARFAAEVERDGLAPPDLDRLAKVLPETDAPLPAYDREPWVIVDRDMAVIGQARFAPRDHALVERIDRVLALQRVEGARGKVALFVAAAGEADVVDNLAVLARRGGADLLELVLTAPRTAGEPGARRFVVLPLQLRATAGRDTARDLDSRPPALTLLVSPEGLTVFAHDGRIDLGPLSSAPARLVDLRRAFPDEVQLAIAIDPTSRYRDLVAVALAAHATFHRLSLVDVPRSPFKDQLGARLRRRSAARFEVPEGGATMAARAEALRGCYLDALDREPGIAGELTVRPGPPPTLDPGGPADEELRRCLLHRAGALAARAPVRLLLAPR